MLMTLSRSLFAITITMMTPMCGCHMKPNVREFYSGNTRVSASLNKGNPRYVIFEVDYTIPGKIPSVLLELPNGEAVALADLDIAHLERLGPPRSRTELDDRDGKKRVRCSFRGFAAIVADGRIEGVTVWVDSEVGTSPGLWDMAKKRRYVLPMNEREVRELFGEPDKILDWAAL
ncbi:hypothetical protein [Fontivita pretiosa]|uniref:hypothetical protein n=1 Tax=Fontivita pretiosa TaxID=2989684 RepID=UPI003D16D736